MKQTYPRLSICNYDREKTSNFTNICHCWKYFPNPGMELTSFVSGIESRFLTSATWETLFERGSPFWLWTSLISGMLKLFSHYVRLLWPKGLKHIRLPALHPLLEFVQVCVHWIGDAIQPSHPLWPSSPSAFISGILI